MAQDIILKVKEEPIIIRMSKQGMTGRSGPAGVKGDDGITWELALVMEDSPNGRCTMSLYKNGNLCSDEIHYAYVQVLKYGTTKFVASNYNSNFQGTYSFEYENVRCIFVTVFQDSFMDTILCANTCNYGRSATITVGNVQSGETPKVVNTGDPIDAVFDFTLPKGDQGEVSVLRTVTLPAGQDAYVQDNNPSPNVAELIFGIPNGASCAARVEDRNLYIEAGTLFTPQVSEDGIISWTNNGEQDNPTSVRIGINPRGDWSSTATYARLDYVRGSNGNGYLAKKAVPAGTAVTNTTYWMRIVDKGDKGDPPNLNIGTVTAKNYGEAPTVTVENNTPSAGTHRLNFGLPMGKTPTIEIGNVEILNGGANPTVNWRPNQAQTGGILDFGLPNLAGLGARVEVFHDDDLGFDVNTLILESGAIYTPSVSSSGVISWTNNAGMTNPPNVNIKGAKGDQGYQGKSLVSIVQYYALNNSTTAPADSTFNTTVKNPTASNKYVWAYETLTFNDPASSNASSTTNTAKHIISVYGDKGDAGADGKSLTSIEQYFAANNSSNAPADSAFSTTVKNPTSTNKYVWGYEKMNWSDSTNTVTPKRIIAVYGDKGDPGQAGTSVPWSGITGSPTDNAELVTKLDEYLPRATTYYNTEVIDSMTDGVALVSLSSSVNASLYNALKDSFAYVIQFYYSYVGADRNHVQIAFPYYANRSKMAWRCYRSNAWGDWQVVDVNHTHDDRYYTESETDTLLAGKADSGHTHSNYVLNSGDTMTGTLKIEQGDTWLKSTAIDGTVAPATGTNTPSLRFIDKNNQTLGLININQPVTNILKMQLAMRHYINGTWTYKYPLQLMLDTSGNVSYGVANAENFRTAIDAAATSHNHDSAYVNISGDTMTDSLSIKKSAYDISASSISALTDTIYAVKDKNNRNLCYLRGQQQTNGDVSIDIRARRYNNNANVDNYLFLKVATDGTRSVSVTDATIWRNALGASSGVWTIAQGGTGGTDSGWKSLTNSTVFTGTITYRKIGAFCFMTGAIKLANNLTSDYVDLGTMPTGYRPNTNSVYGFGGGQDDLGVLRITNGGAIRFFKTADVSTWTTNANIYFQFSYFCE